MRGQTNNGRGSCRTWLMPPLASDTQIACPKSGEPSRDIQLCLRLQRFEPLKLQQFQQKSNSKRKQCTLCDVRNDTSQSTRKDRRQNSEADQGHLHLQGGILVCGHKLHGAADELPWDMVLVVIHAEGMDTAAYIRGQNYRKICRYEIHVYYLLSYELIRSD